MPNITGWSKSNKPTKPSGPHPPAPNPGPPPGPEESFSTELDINLLLLSLARSIDFSNLKYSVESLFDQFDDGEKSAQSFPRPKYADDGLYSRPGRRRNSEIIARLQGLADEIKSFGDQVQKPRDDFGHLEKAQNETLEEFRNFRSDVKNEFQVRNKFQPFTNPDGEDFIPEAKPQVPFRQVDPSTPGKDLGVTVEQTGPRGESIVITLHRNEYSDTDTEGPQGPPVSELGRPRPGLPTYPQPGPKPDRTPPEKPKPNPKPKP